jgi:hypothetical protein
VDGDVIGMVIAAMRIERDDDVRLDVGDDAFHCRLDFEHVDVCQRPRIVVPLSLLARRVVEAKKHRIAEAKYRARRTELLFSKRADIFDLADGGMGLARFAARRTRERDARAAVGQVRKQPATVKEFVVWVRVHGEHRGAPS